MQSLMTMTELSINTDRLLNDFEELAEIGATLDGGVSRLALSNEDLEARSWFADKIEAIGLQLHDDDAGNLSGILRCGESGAKTLLIGSHLDSVPNGGRYDGSVGVLAALECLRRVKEEGLRLPYHLEAINFTDEEGCWQSLFGSRGLTGTSPKIIWQIKKRITAPFVLPCSALESARRMCKRPSAIRRR